MTPSDDIDLVGCSIIDEYEGWLLRCTLKSEGWIVEFTTKEPLTYKPYYLFLCDTWMPVQERCPREVSLCEHKTAVFKTVSEGFKAGVAYIRQQVVKTEIYIVLSDFRQANKLCEYEIIRLIQSLSSGVDNLIPLRE